jgi:hypothetical protein
MFILCGYEGDSGFYLAEIRLFSELSRVPTFTEWYRELYIPDGIVFVQ